MAIQIICSPGHYGGVMSGKLDSKIGILPEEIAVYQHTAAGWSVRALGVTAARLWSCDLGYDSNTYVKEWMAAVVSKGFNPNRKPEPGDRVFQVTQKLASSLSIHLDERKGRTHLAGVVGPVRPSHPDSLYRFAWWRNEPIAEDDEPYGWDPIDIDESMKYEFDTGTPDAAWAAPAAKALQHAVLHVGADFANHFNDHPEDVELPGVDHSALARRNKLKILPARHVRATAFTACIDVRILTFPGTSPGSKLSGVVTGLGCAYDHVRELGPDDVPRDDELLRVSAWGITAGRKKPIGTVLCRPSGYWAFDELPAETEHADEFAISVSMQKTEISLDAFPTLGGEVVAFRRFKRSVMSSTHARELVLTQR